MTFVRSSTPAADKKSLAFIGIVSILFAVTAAGGESQGRFDGIWLFDGAPAYPGVTLMEVATHGGRTTGTITTTWYGPMACDRAAD